jgi:hypothetical protein
MTEKKYNDKLIYSIIYCFCVIQMAVLLLITYYSTQGNYETYRWALMILQGFAVQPVFIAMMITSLVGIFLKTGRYFCSLVLITSFILYISNGIYLGEFGFGL